MAPWRKKPCLVAEVWRPAGSALGVRVALWALMLCIVLLLPGLAHGLERQTMTGYAYDLTTDQLLYVERHQRWFDGDRIRHQAVTYETATGETFGEKTLRFDDDELRPTFVLMDRRRGYLEALEETAQGFVVGSRKGAAGSWRQRRLGQSAFVADAGFDRMIERHWQSLLDGQKIKLPFLVPVALKSVMFQIAQRKRTESTVTFRMSAASWLLRRLVPPIDVTYVIDGRQLIEYVGVSNLRDERLKNYRVRIAFPQLERTSQQVPELAAVVIPSLDELSKTTFF